MSSLHIVLRLFRNHSRREHEEGMQIADLAGVELPTDRKIDGGSIQDVLLGESTESKHEYIYYYNADGQNGGADNQNVVAWETDSADYSQHWQKVSTGDGTYKLIKRDTPDYAIFGGNGGARRQNVRLFDSSSSNYGMQWYITPEE